MGMGYWVLNGFEKKRKQRLFRPVPPVQRTPLFLVSSFSHFLIDAFPGVEPRANDNVAFTPPTASTS